MPSFGKGDAPIALPQLLNATCLELTSKNYTLFNTTTAANLTTSCIYHVPPSIPLPPDALTRGILFAVLIFMLIGIGVAISMLTRRSLLCTLWNKPSFELLPSLETSYRHAVEHGQRGDGKRRFVSVSHENNAATKIRTITVLENLDLAPWKDRDARRRVSAARPQEIELEEVVNTRYIPSRAAQRIAPTAGSQASETPSTSYIANPAPVITTSDRAGGNRFGSFLAPPPYSKHHWRDTV